MSIFANYCYFQHSGGLTTLKTKKLQHFGNVDFANYCYFQHSGGLTTLKPKNFHRDSRLPLSSMAGVVGCIFLKQWCRRNAASAWAASLSRFWVAKSAVVPWSSRGRPAVVPRSPRGRRGCHWGPVAHLGPHTHVCILLEFMYQKTDFFKACNSLGFITLGIPKPLKIQDVWFCTFKLLLEFLGFGSSRCHRIVGIYAFLKKRVFQKTGNSWGFVTIRIPKLLKNKHLHILHFVNLLRFLRFYCHSLF